MESSEWIEYHANRTIERLLPDLRKQSSEFIEKHPQEWEEFEKRLIENFNILFGLLHHLYGNQYDFFFHIRELVKILADSWINRPDDLKDLDRKRLLQPDWFQSNQMLGGVCYVDLYSKDLEGLKGKISYFKEIGLTYLHIMPFFKMPAAENDGGYAVSSYRKVHPPLGTIAQLSELAAELRAEGISLVVDLVFNHTSNEHEWAESARRGDRQYQEYYLLFDNDRLPRAYQQTLREIFPEARPGSFTFDEEMRKWVWTTFNSYQWDLNYANPAVFNQIGSEILFLANTGVEILRLDAVAFTWKKMGTTCENLPEAHLLIQAFNAVSRISAPALLFKSEAIVHPDEVIKYIHPGECQLSYNPLLMAMLWNSLAMHDVRMLKIAISERSQIPDRCAWVNYIRCHDDIGWTFADEDAARFGFNAYEHRRFLNAFYTGRFPSSYARGLPFQENPETGDVRISGTLASLAGLEKAINEASEIEIDLAIKRILLMHGIILTVGGIPLIYLGDEIGVLNDYDYRKNPAKARDSRWVHRPIMDWKKAEKRNKGKTPEARIFQGLVKLIQIRKNHANFSNGNPQIMETGSDQVLGFVRTREGERCLVLANFSPESQVISANVLRVYGMAYQFVDLLTKNTVSLADIALEPYELRLLAS
jgi:amylosucrase